MLNLDSELRSQVPEVSRRDCPACYASLMESAHPDNGCSHCGALLENETCTECGRDAEVQPVIVFETSKMPELMIARSILEGAEIPFLVQGDEALGLFPLGAFGRGPFRHGVAAIIRVPSTRADEARALLDVSISTVLAEDDE